MKSHLIKNKFHLELNFWLSVSGFFVCSHSYENILNAFHEFKSELWVYASPPCLNYGCFWIFSHWQRFDHRWLVGKLPTHDFALNCVSILSRYWVRAAVVKPRFDQFVWILLRDGRERGSSGWNVHYHSKDAISSYLSITRKINNHSNGKRSREQRSIWICSVLPDVTADPFIGKIIFSLWKKGFWFFSSGGDLLVGEMNDFANKFSRKDL